MDSLATDSMRERRANGGEEMTGEVGVGSRVFICFNCYGGMRIFFFTAHFDV
ncbi:hypothetical protein [Burkholderia metallica]|uniref:hypothetical protein n=1 Tax=Burkholderia metallica TaxID=488729 RepID=UPI00131A87FA|nr:hypothetical protein [Burkholderia metallica]